MNPCPRAIDSVEVDPACGYAQQFTEVAPYYDRLMSTVPYRMWVDYLEQLFALLAIQPRRILDLACGTGNVTYELARRGYEVVGVDGSPAMITVAEQKRAHRTGVVEFLTADLRELPELEPFPVATCLYDSLNYLTGPEDLVQAFRSVAKDVVPGGHFIFDTNSVYALEQELFTQSNVPWAQAFRYDWRSRFDPVTRISEIRMQFSVRQVDGSLHEFNELHHERAYRREEIHDALRAADWEPLHTFDAYTTRPPRDQSERWFFVARRR